MSFLEHLEELRWTLVKCASAFLIGVIVVGVFLTRITAFLKWPLEQARLEHPKLSADLLNLSPMGAFGMLVQVCFMGGLVLALPAILFFVAQFVSPALTKKELRVVVPACLSAIGLFLIGAAFGYFLIAPATVKISYQINEMFQTQPMWAAEAYYGMLTWLVLGLGALFEFPILIVLLVYLDVVPVATLWRGWRVALVIITIVAAVITPTPDPFTLFAVAIPMFILYLLSLLVAGRIDTLRRARLKTEEET